MLLKKLCEADGVSGCEDQVRRIILEKIRPLADEVTVDTMGNVIALKKADSSKRVMLCAHMDEVGLIISGITEKGYLKFKTVGGIDPRVLISKRVRIGKDKIPGVIGIKAIHLQTKEERETVPKIKELFIDIGASSEKEAKKHISLGDYAAFDTDFDEFGRGRIKAKAIDDRAGCAVLVELMKKSCMYDTYFCFTVQEEVGLRGAQIAAHRIRPDIALILESTTCSDVHGCEEKDYVTELGGGVAVSFMDMRTIADKQFYKWLFDEGKKSGVNVQLKRAAAGGNDAGAVHISGTGVKTASLSIPCRYLHSPASVASLSDIEDMQKLAELFMDRIDEVI